MAMRRKVIPLVTIGRKKRAGPCPARHLLTLASGSLLLIAGRRVKAPEGLSLPRLGPHSGAKPNAAPPECDDPKPSRAACHHSTQTRPTKITRDTPRHSGTMPRFRETSMTG